MEKKNPWLFDVWAKLIVLVGLTFLIYAAKDINNSTCQIAYHPYETPFYKGRSSSYIKFYQLTNTVSYRDLSLTGLTSIADEDGVFVIQHSYLAALHPRVIYVICGLPLLVVIFRIRKPWFASSDMKYVGCLNTIGGITWFMWALVLFYWLSETYFR